MAAYALPRAVGEVVARELLQRAVAPVAAVYGALRAHRVALLAHVLVLEEEAAGRARFDGHERDVVLAHRSLPGGGGAGAEQRLERRRQLAGLRAAGPSGLPRGLEFWHAGGAAEGRPLGATRAGEEEPALGGLVEAVGRADAVKVAIDGRRRGAALVVDQLIGAGVEVGGDHRRHQLLAGAALLAGVQPQQQHRRGGEGGVHVRVRLVGRHHAPGLALQLVDRQLGAVRQRMSCAHLAHRVAGDRAGDGVERGTARVRAVIAVRRAVQVRQPRVERATRLVIDTEAFRHAGPEVVQHEVRALDELMRDLAPFLALEIERDALLALGGREGEEAAGRETAVVAVQRLDFDHARAEVREDAGGVRRGEERGEVDHRHARQRAAGNAPVVRRAALRARGSGGRFLQHLPRMLAEARRPRPDRRLGQRRAREGAGLARRRAVQPRHLDDVAVVAHLAVLDGLQRC